MGTITKALFVVFSCTLLVTGCTKEETYLTTTETQKWNRENSYKISKFSGESTPDLELYSDSLEQEIDGFGGCFNEMGWAALSMLNDKDREEILQNLFSQNGCAFNICRMPLGANDYSMDWYSYNETPNDFEMINFSVEHDKKFLIPYMKEALRISPNLQIWASPWCPPSWMKTNNHYACWATIENDLSPTLNGNEMVTQFRMEDKYLSAYALYFQKFISAYKSEGINIASVHPQNEMNSCQKFPSCIWRPEDISKFIGDYLGPQLEKSNPNIDIWLGTIERPHPERIDTIMKNEAAFKYIKGVGFQWAGKGAIAYVRKTYPSKRLMQSETECGDGSNNWAAAEYTFDLVKHYINNGANSYMYWNMVLEENGISRWGWKQNSMVSVNTADRTFTYNPEFYLMKHLAHFVKPGAHKIKHKGEYTDALSFINKDGSVVVLLVNKETTEKPLTIKMGKYMYSTVLKSKSLNTLLINKN